MKKILYYDCFAGISGDMNLGAMIDLGVDPDYLKDQLAKLNITGFHLDISREIRKGISGTRAKVVIENEEGEEHRHLGQIEKLINKSNLSEAIKSKSLAIFDLIAEAEAKVHQISKQQVHFHEVGALDSIADIVGASICHEYLDVDEIIASPVQLGGGIVMCAHGKMPVPAPATAEILQAIPVKTGLVDYEATTPTGAAILAATVDSFTSNTELMITRTGYGIGQRDGELPNVLRVYLAESPEKSAHDVSVEKAMMLECNIDDMNPEWFQHVTSLLFEAGAADVYITPILMKKSRPGNLLSVLCDLDAVDRMKEIIFTQTSSIGLRSYAVTKNMLRRDIVIVHTKYGDVNVKRSFYGDRLVNEKPEYEQCRRLSMEHHVSLEEIQKEVLKKL